MDRQAALDSRRSYRSLHSHQSADALRDLFIALLLKTENKQRSVGGGHVFVSHSRLLVSSMKPPEDPDSPPSGSEGSRTSAGNEVIDTRHDKQEGDQPSL